MELVEHADEGLIRALYVEHAAPLLGFVLHLLDGDRQLTEDVVQETLLRGWRHPTVGRGVVSRQSSSSNQASVATATDPATFVVVRTEVHQRDWGTAIDVQLHGVARGQRCRLIAVARDGRQDIAASCQVTYEGRADITGATAIPTPALSTLRVVSDDGRVLAGVPVHG